MQNTKDTEEVENSEEIKTPDHTPEIAKKVSRFGNQWGMSKFGKWATAFNPPNKQRPGRAAGRGR